MTNILMLFIIGMILLAIVILVNVWIGLVDGVSRGLEKLFSGKKSNKSHKWHTLEQDDSDDKPFEV